MNNWIALFRNLDQWSMFKDRYALQLYLYLLVRACHREYEDEGVYVAKGFVKTSGPEMTSALNMPRGIMRGRLKKLQQGRYISVDSKERRKYMVVAIRNFDDFMQIPMTSQQGWFKLSTEIINKEWFSNSKVLQVYTYIQMCVNRPNNGLMVNQAYMSINGIARKTSLTAKEVRTCLRSLIKYGEILTSYDEHSRKTIVSSLSEVFPIALIEDCRTKVLSSQPSSNPNLAQSEHNNITDIVAESVSNRAQSSNGKSSSLSDRYRDINLSNNPSTTQTTPNTDPIAQHHTRAKFVQNGQGHIIRDRERVRDNSSSLSIKRAHAHAREEEISDDENEEISECEDLKEDTVWQDAIMASSGISNREILLSYINAFGQQNFCNGKKHKDGCDLKSHFHNWLIKKLKEEKRVEQDASQSKKAISNPYAGLLKRYKQMAEKEKENLVQHGYSISDLRQTPIKTMDSKGERYRVAYLLSASLADYALFSNVKVLLSEEQLSETARLIRDHFGYLTMAQFNVFFDNLKMGRYGKSYNKIEPGYIMQGLDIYTKSLRAVI